MRLRSWTLFALVMFVVPASAADGVDPAKIGWKKTVIDTKFRSEGVAIADVNKDGKTDVLTGDVWYEAPTWKVHEIRTPGEFGDGEKSYSNSFLCWSEDVNGDSWTDLIVIGWPGKTCHWYENPKNKSGHWKEHAIWHSACNETPLYVDLLGTGKRVLVMGWQPKGENKQGQMAYFSPGKDPTEMWTMHPISEPSKPGHEIPSTQRYSHGLGVGDINGDQRQDVMIPQGWWEQPEEAAGQPWKFHPAKLGPACANMYAFDIDGDNKADVVSSSAHKFGIWAYLQRPGSGDNPAFLTKPLFPKLVSETHSMERKDIDGDGLADLITGKRFYSHGKREPGWDGPPAIYWLRAKKTDGYITFTPIVIDNDSGVGTQVLVEDFNGDGLLDVISANKRGVRVIEQVRK